MGIVILVGFERPTYSELLATYVPHGGSGPGHFFAVGIIKTVRVGATMAAVGLGLLLAMIGSLKIPRNSSGSRTLRNVAWILFCIALAACLGLAAT